MARDELELRRLFQAERAADAKSVPAYARVMARPAPADHSYLRAIALAAAIVLVSVAASSNIARRHKPVDMANAQPAAAKSEVVVEGSRATQALVSAGETPALQPASRRRYTAKAKPVTLSEWKSPTAALLNTPGAELWTTAPTVGKYEFPRSSE